MNATTVKVVIGDMTITLDESAALEVMRLVELEICRVFRVPPRALQPVVPGIDE